MVCFEAATLYSHFAEQTERRCGATAKCRSRCVLITEDLAQVLPQELQLPLGTLWFHLSCFRCRECRRCTQNLARQPQGAEACPICVAGPGEAPAHGPACRTQRASFKDGKLKVSAVDDSACPGQAPGTSVPRARAVGLSAPSVRTAWVGKVASLLSLVIHSSRGSCPRRAARLEALCVCLSRTRDRGPCVPPAGSHRAAVLVS